MKILLFSSDYSGENGQAVVTREVAKNVLGDRDQVRELIYRPGSSLRSFGSWCLAAVKALSFMAIQKPTFIYVVISRTFLGFVRDIPVLAYALLGGRVVAHCHGSDLVALLKDRWYSPVARFLYARCEVVFPCKYLAGQLNRQVAVGHVCENALADEPPRLSDAGTGAESNRLTVLWNSNVMASKGYLDVVSAVRQAVEQGHSINFVSFGSILSDTEMRNDDLKKKLSQFENFDWFQHLGKVPHHEAVEQLSYCDVVALPSRYPSEMQPLAIIEAMCCGKNVVISDRPSLRVTVGDYPACIVSPSSPEEISAILIEMCKQKAEDTIGFARSNLQHANVARDRFSVERFRSRMSDILFRKS